MKVVIINFYWDYQFDRTDKIGRKSIKFTPTLEIYNILLFHIKHMLKPASYKQFLYHKEPSLSLSLSRYFYHLSLYHLSLSRSLYHLSLSLYRDISIISLSIELSLSSLSLSRSLYHLSLYRDLSIISLYRDISIISLSI